MMRHYELKQVKVKQKLSFLKKNASRLRTWQLTQTTGRIWTQILY
jgi:hypothetical protein